MTRDPFIRLWRWLGVHFLVTCFAFLASAGWSGSEGVRFGYSRALAQVQAQGQEAGIPAGWESYLHRPDILTIKPQAMPTSKSWNKMKAAHFAFVAQLLEMYPKNTDIYFLARDSEHLYDVARMVTQETADTGRIHLLNVSRGNMRDPNLKTYLSENGISDETLRAGKRVLFVDTGFSGTIPAVIATHFAPELKESLKTHLVVSSTSKHPSSRAFLVHINPTVNGFAPAFMHGTIISYEHMPRYTDRSSRYISAGGKMHPISQKNQVTDGSVSKEKSLEYMADLRLEWQNPDTQKWVNDQREKLRHLKGLLLDKDPSAKTKIQDELTRLAQTDEGRLFEAYLRDAIEMKKNSAFSFQGGVESFGLRAEKKSYDAAAESKKADLIKKFPEWQPVLENPEAEIPKLFQEKNWQMIGNLLDISVDYEIDLILLKNLFDGAASGEKRSLQVLTIEKADQSKLAMLAEHVFSEPHAYELRDLFKVLIQRANQETLRFVATYGFPNENALKMKDLMKLVIHRGNQIVSGDLLTYRLWDFPRSEIKDIVKLILEKAGSDEVDTLHYKIFDRNATGPEYEILKAAASQRFASKAKRKEWLDQELRKINSPLADLSLPVKISPDLKPGDQVEVKENILTVIKVAGVGRRGIVFQVKAENGAVYALKVAKDKSAETLESLAKESVKAKAWQDLKIPHAKVLVQEKTFVLKPWINGMNGEEVVQKFANGDASMKLAAEEVIKLVSRVRNQGSYIGDLRPANLIWNGKAWVIIDSGSIQRGMTLEEAQAKWNAADERGPKFERRWQVPPPQLPRTCRDVFALK